MRTQSAGRSRPGFTLTELVVAILIISVLAHLSIPFFRKTIERMRAKEGERVLLSLLGAQMRYKVEHGSYATAIDALDIEVPPMRYFGAPTLANPNGAGSLGTVQHKDFGYYLYLADDAGDIACYSATTGLCAELGY